MRLKYKEYPKEFYRLWWEYLRRSESYKEFCSTAGPPWQIPGEQVSTLSIPRTYIHCGDVHKTPLNDFEQWYKMKRRQVLGVSTEIVSLKDLMRFKVDSAIQVLTEKLDREPTLKDFQEHCLDDWRIVDPDAFVVSPGYFEVAADVAHQVKGWMKGKAYRNPTNQFAPLAKYLKAFDIKQAGFTGKAAIYQAVEAGVFEPETDTPIYNHDLDPGFDAKERRFNQWCANAIQIIKNVEMGVFPGRF
jgi:hypothetical protein